MLEWDALHPYNAVHAAHLPAPLDLARLQRVFADGLTHHGLVGLALDRRRGTWHFEEGTTPLGTPDLAAAIEPAPDLGQEVESQLNRPFPSGRRFTPFRLFAAPDADGFWLGLTYFHAIADAGCVVLLMRDLVQAYLHTAGGKPDRVVASRRIRPSAGTLARALVTFPARVQALRTCCRPRRRSEGDGPDGLLLFALEAGALPALAAEARSLGITLNDLWLAALMKALDPLAPGRRKAARRRNLALGCVASLRGSPGTGDARYFGVELGSFMVRHPAPPDLPLAGLAKELQAQTQRIKDRRLYLHSWVDMAISRRLLAFFSPARRRNLYQKHYPLWGGITNVNLNSLWKLPDQPPGLRYVRAVSPGAATPLALCVTTTGSQVELALSYRTTALLRPEAERVRDGFLAQLRQLLPPP